MSSYHYYLSHIAYSQQGSPTCHFITSCKAGPQVFHRAKFFMKVNPITSAPTRFQFQLLTNLWWVSARLGFFATEWALQSALKPVCPMTKSSWVHDGDLSTFGRWTRSVITKLFPFSQTKGLVNAKGETDSRVAISPLIWSSSFVIPPIWRKDPSMTLCFIIP